MKPKLVNFLELLFCFILCAGISAKPLEQEDLDSLLPPEPQNINDTIAAVVQDPVVKDAVKNAAANGTLNGLVVKRRVFIMPANNPKKVISRREQLFTVPPEHLEDVRRNITEAKDTDSGIEDENAVAENQSLLYDNADTYTTENSESEASEFPLEESAKEPEMEFVEGDRRTTLSREESKKVAVPIMAVVDPSNLPVGKVESPIVAVLPDPSENDMLEDQLEFLAKYRRNIQKEAQAYIDRTSLSVDPERWRSSASSESATTLSSQDLPWSENRDTRNVLADELLLTPLLAPRFAIVAPFLHPTEGGKYPRDVNDMDVAEDIIFRPLFRYHQQAQQRSKYREEENRRRYGYRQYGDPYRNYNYPRRDYYRYRPRYSNDDY